MELIKDIGQSKRIKDREKHSIRKIRIQSEETIVREDLSDK
jgi:hypothetical protein